MAKTAEQRGPIGAWLVEERLSRGWKSGAVARAALERARVVKVAPSLYGEWEAGTRKPNRDQQEALERFYGSSPKAPTLADPSLVELLREQKETNRLLAARLDALEALVTMLVSAPPPEAGVEVMRTWGRSALARIRSQAQPLDPAPAGEG